MSNNTHNRRNSGRNTTYAAVLHHYASKVNVKNQLSSVTLANVLSGDTCPPISLGDFEGYLAHQEYSIENLHFIVWFQDYRRRFFALPPEDQALSPGPTEFSFSTPSPARTAAVIAESKQHAAVLRHKASTTSSAVLLFSGGPNPPPPSPTTPASSSSGTFTSAVSDASTASTHSAHEDVERGGPPPALRPHAQPLRAECTRAVATFFAPSAPEELTLDSALRDAIIRDLTWNTHPNVFQPVYEEIYHSVESVSLPRFLAAAAVNINLPKQLYWYGVGLTYFLFGAVVAIVLITCLPGSGPASRCWRLCAVPFASLGWMSMYSGWRGFCTEVWSRGNTQLRVWELRELDTEAAAHWDRVLDDAASTASPALPVLPEAHEPDGAQPNVGAIAPFAEPALPDFLSHPDCDIDISDAFAANGEILEEPKLPADPPAPPISAELTAQPAAAIFPPGPPDASNPTPEEEEQYRRPPVFGPERVVRDPRIQALHRQVGLDMWWVGFWFNLAFVPLVLAVPGLR
ncbi:hypothetical protein CERSUDRAFT_91071 [Gelatoporia subvermispora B]|uniref:RGS domain-containing protein n=1 Tax=Ceriporiopsis subvermispora (strain B) TaxID=914234 RepID=M2R7E2_CERS8|nr:hypothetical protein CERSUDRAFT_91071 [Gelatoporia subvermispora B]